MQRGSLFFSQSSRVSSRVLCRYTYLFVEEFDGLLGVFLFVCACIRLSGFVFQFFVCYALRVDMRTLLERVQSAECKSAKNHLIKEETHFKWHFGNQFLAPPPLPPPRFNGISNSSPVCWVICLLDISYYYQCSQRVFHVQFPQFATQIPREQHTL